jgi:voltage-gated potassium channel
LRAFWTVVRKERVVPLLTLFLFLLCAGALGFYGVEGRLRHPPLTVIDCFWWGVVTMASVGYGDIFPKTLAGRIVGVLLIMFGVVMFSLITAVVASIMVEKKLREVRGLDAFKWKDHLVICGWNEFLDDLLRWIVSYSPANRDVILISDIEEEAFTDIKFKYRNDLNLHFVKGDFTHEVVLERANIAEAASVILLIDVSGGKTLDNADERVILATLAVKHMAPKARVSAEILNRRNEPHLRRAKADDVFVRGRHSGFYLSSSAVAPGLPLVISEMLNNELGARLEKIEIPRQFVGKTFRDLSTHVRGSSGNLLVGILSKSREIGLSEILSDDMSGIDQFIKQKFEEADLLSSFSGGYRANLSPPDDYCIDTNDQGVVIAASVERSAQ